MSNNMWILIILVSVGLALIGFGKWRRNVRSGPDRRMPGRRPWDDYVLPFIGILCLGSQVSCQTIIDHQATRKDGTKSSTYVYTTFGGDAASLERTPTKLVATGLNTSKSTMSGIRTTGTVIGLDLASQNILGLGQQHVQVENAKTAADLGKAGISAQKAVDLAGIKAGTDALKITTVRRFTWTEDAQPAYYWP